ncbi:MAG: putative toxin-antitoxin system toxin component, PIN family [Rhodocyclaceae bacterium]|jgi:putative PIN family toxin of toxin-antitoxin system|nr:putative toxin-antitoxin system toxin component, PIN family [Rhodocyclaceae bacterium]MBK6905839.1 putative toxin-antitoxin system toxin component, PIN family [Rhodocyclaceae bacterium]
MRAESTSCVAIDTNVWLSAFLNRRGVPAETINRFMERHHPAFSAASFEELHSRLWQPKFDRVLSLETRRSLLHDVERVACWVEIPARLISQTWCRDTDDDEFIRVALASGAVRLITGDADLLTLDPIDDLRLLTPRAALDEIAQGKVP